MVHDTDGGVNWPVDVEHVDSRCLGHADDVVCAAHVVALEGEKVEPSAGLRHALGDHVVHGDDALGSWVLHQAVGQVEGVVDDVLPTSGLNPHEVAHERPVLVIGISDRQVGLELGIVEKVPIDHRGIEGEQSDAKIGIIDELARQLGEHSGDAAIGLKSEDLLIEGHSHPWSLWGASGVIRQHAGVRE